MKIYGGKKIVQKTLLSAGLPSIQRDHTTEDHESTNPEAQGRGLPQKDDAHDSGKNDFTGHEHTALPSLAIEKSLVH